MNKCMGTRVQSLKKQFTNEQLNRFINFVLRYIADLDIPIKRCVHIVFLLLFYCAKPCLVLTVCMLHT